MDDVAEAFDVVLHQGKVGEVYNIGTKKERTVRDVANDICQHFGMADKMDHVRDRAFNDRCTAVWLPAKRWSLAAQYACTTL